jgi:hypothetical protein
MTARDRRPDQPRHAPRGHQHYDDGRLDAHAGLMAQLEALVRAGEMIPCLGHRAAWTATADKTARSCAEACLACPALSGCAGYVLAHPEPEGTWAGTTAKERAASPAGIRQLLARRAARGPETDTGSHHA